jgi:hypothetical protein
VTKKEGSCPPPTLTGKDRIALALCEKLKAAVEDKEKKPFKVTCKNPEKCECGDKKNVKGKDVFQGEFDYEFCWTLSGGEVECKDKEGKPKPPDCKATLKVDVEFEGSGFTGKCKAKPEDPEKKACECAN